MSPMHGHEHMHDSMGMPLLPTWLQVTWAVALGIVAVLHIVHAATATGQHRWWHGGHVVMALGMIAMYLFMMSRPWVTRLTLAVFSVLTVVLLAICLVWWRRERVPNPLWVVAALDALAMAYMSLPGGSRPAPLDWAFVVYLGLQALVWAFGLWGWLPLYRPAEHDPPVRAGTAGPRSGVETATGAARRAAVRVGLSGRTGFDVAITLTVMDASMAYMLAVM